LTLNPSNEKFIDIDIDDFYKYIQRQIESTKDQIEDREEYILNMIDFLESHEVLVNTDEPEKRFIMKKEKKGIE
jgi:hypothetical protein